MLLTKVHPQPAFTYWYLLTIIKFKQVLHVVLVLSLLTLNMGIPVELILNTLLQTQQP